jgi:hypothetical protein
VVLGTKDGSSFAGLVWPGVQGAILQTRKRSRPKFLIRPQANRMVQHGPNAEDPPYCAGGGEGGARAFFTVSITSSISKGLLKYADAPICMASCSVFIDA